MKIFRYILLVTIISQFQNSDGYGMNRSDEVESADNEIIWSVGEKDGSGDEFALAPDGFENFKYEDFGFEDKFFVIGYHDETEEIPYVLPGPVDTWGGTWRTSGWRSNEVNILFSVDTLPQQNEYTLYIELADFAKEFLPVVKVYINDQEQRVALEADGYDRKSQRSPSKTEPTIDEQALSGQDSSGTPVTIEIPVDGNVIRSGGNKVTITVLEGSWIKFDQIRLEGSPLTLQKNDKLFVRNVRTADYQLTTEGGSYQPLLVDVEHLDGAPVLGVKLDGELIFSETVEMGPEPNRDWGVADQE